MLKNRVPLFARTRHVFNQQHRFGKACTPHRVCSRLRSACRACMPTISNSSKPASLFTMRSIAGAATRRARRMVGPPTRRAADMSRGPEAAFNCPLTAPENKHARQNHSIIGPGCRLGGCRADRNDGILSSLLRRAGFCGRYGLEESRSGLWPFGCGDRSRSSLRPSGPHHAALDCFVARAPRNDGRCISVRSIR
jgi:hypothetical protein